MRSWSRITIVMLKLIVQEIKPLDPTLSSIRIDLDCSQPHTPKGCVSLSVCYCPRHRQAFCCLCHCLCNAKVFVERTCFLPSRRLCGNSCLLHMISLACCCVARVTAATVILHWLLAPLGPFIGTWSIRVRVSRLALTPLRIYHCQCCV